MNWLPDEEFKCFSDDFFDDFINLIDFPLEDIDNTNGEGDWQAKLQDLEPPPMEMFTSLPSEFTSRDISKSEVVGIQKTIPILKQSSSSEALSGITTNLSQSSSPPDIKVSKQFQSSSPVSVLENSDCSFSSQILSFPVKGMRSKRKRPTTLRLRYLLSFVSIKNEKLTQAESESESYISSEKLTKKNRKNQLTTAASKSDGIIRKCSHCETTKTPQWREGPNGPKTLCNACGVRFRSGRLVPEYRPFSSPTFIPSLHSNSHRKIIEMRKKDDQYNSSVIQTVISGS